MNSCFEKRQLWGVALESNFGKQLSETTFRGSFGSLGGRCPEQLSITTLLWGTALWRSFGEQLWGAGAALHGSFEEPQLWGAALGSSFRTQLWGADFGGRFEEYLSGTALANSHGEPLWGTGLKHSRFGATALQRCFGEPL